MNAHRASVAASQAWLLASALIGMCATIVMTIVVARFAPLAVLGFFALIGTIFSLARDVTDLGTGSAACREATRSPERETEVIAQLLAWRLIPSAILAAGCLALALTQDTRFDQGILVATAIIVLAGFNNGLFAVFQLRQLQSVPAAINISVNLLVLAGSGIVIASGADTRHFVMLILMREAGVVIANRIAAIRHLPAAPKVIQSIKGIRQWFLGPLSHYALAALAWHLLLNSGMFIILVFSSEAQLGAYGAAFRLATPLFSLSWLLTAPLVPVFALAWKSDRDTFTVQVARSLQLAIGIAVLLATIGAVLSADLIEVLLGAALLRETGTAASDSLRWFMLAMAASIAVAVCAAALLAMQKERDLVRIAWSSLFITLAAGCVSAAASQTSLVAASVAAGMVASAMAALLILRNAVRLQLGITLLPALVALGVLLMIPASADGIVKVGAGCILGAVGGMVIYFQPGMRRYRQDQDRLVRATAWNGPGAGGSDG